MRRAQVAAGALLLALGGAMPASFAGDREAPAGSLAQVIPSPAGPGSMAPHLALTRSGSVVMSWLEPTGEKTHALKFATLDGDQWSPTRRVAESAGWFVNPADFPSVTPMTGKDWVAHRLVMQPGGTYSYDLALAISRDGGVTWGAPFTPHTDGTRTEHGFATLFPWGDGFGAVWLDGRNTQQDTGRGERDEGVGGMTVRFARLGFDGRIRESGAIDELACDCCATDAAMATDGPVVTYRNRTPDEIRDIAVSRYADGRWQPPGIVANDGWQIAGCPVNGSTIAARGQRVAVAWYTAPDRRARVQLAWSTDGGRTFAAPVLVDAGAVNGRMDVALLADDSALVTWTGKSASGDGQLRQRRIPASGAPGPVQVIAESDVSRSAGFPQMINGRDRVVYAWTRPGAPSQVVTAWAPLPGR
ncbi:MAG: glycoside hydrolase [Gammaproteobacteria bacterium]|nr:glycoside hydrolase [Gammaproteobacteria bacterium]